MRARTGTLTEAGRLRWVVLIVAALALAAPARALDSNDLLTLSLAGGVDVTGWFLRAERGDVVLMVDGVQTPVPVALISAARRGGVELPMAEFRAEVAEAEDRLTALRTAPMPRPPPVVVGGLSMIWAGAGYASLGDWREAAAWSVVDGVMLGTAAYAAFGSRDRGLLISAVGLDLFFRGYAAADSARQARRRRTSAAAGARSGPSSDL